MSIKLFMDEREAWETTWGPGGEKHRAKFEREFRNLYPHGHRNSIRPFVAVCEALRHDRRRSMRVKTRWLQDIHPRAFEFLAAYGKDYRPFAWRTWPEFGLNDPESRQCFKNSWKLMHAYNAFRSGPDIAPYPKWKKRDGAVYVEGICVGAISLPMLHAWNAVGTHSNVAFDWTHAAACRWDKYFGFPVSEPEYEELTELISPGRKRYISIFNSSMFEAVESRLTAIATSRDTRKEAA